MSLTDADKTWITEKFQEQETRITEKFAVQLLAHKNQMTEQLRDVETSLLTEFHKWASPSEARQRTHAAALRAIDLEMESLSERVDKLEGSKPQ
jgi:hypothetical protein